MTSRPASVTSRSPSSPVRARQRSPSQRNSNAQPAPRGTSPALASIGAPGRGLGVVRGRRDAELPGRREQTPLPSAPPPRPARHRRRGDRRQGPRYPRTPTVARVVADAARADCDRGTVSSDERWNGVSRVGEQPQAAASPTATTVDGRAGTGPVAVRPRPPTRAAPGHRVRTAGPSRPGGGGSRRRRGPSTATATGRRCPACRWPTGRSRAGSRSRADPATPCGPVPRRHPGRGRPPRGCRPGRAAPWSAVRGSRDRASSTTRSACWASATAGVSGGASWVGSTPRATMRPTPSTTAATRPPAAVRRAAATGAAGSCRRLRGPSAVRGTSVAGRAGAGRRTGRTGVPGSARAAVEDPALQLGGRLEGRDRGAEGRDHVEGLVEGATAVGAVRQVGLHGALLVGLEGGEGGADGVGALGAGAHARSPSASTPEEPRTGPSRTRSRATPANIRDFTVPIGTPVRLATSRWE